MPLDTQMMIILCTYVSCIIYIIYIIHIMGIYVYIYIWVFLYIYIYIIILDPAVLQYGTCNVFFHVQCGFWGTPLTKTEKPTVPIRLVAEIFVIMNHGDRATVI